MEAAILLIHLAILTGHPKSMFLMEIHTTVTVLNKATSIVTIPLSSIIRLTLRALEQICHNLLLNIQYSYSNITSTGFGSPSRTGCRIFEACIEFYVKTIHVGKSQLLKTGSMACLDCTY